MTEIEMSPLTQLLAPYDLTDLASGLGALQLCPENATFQLRFDRLALLTATQAYLAGKPAISASRWRALTNTAPVASPQNIMMEDPPENPFVDEIRYMGGGYRVLVGIVQGSSLILSTLLAALRQLSGSPRGARLDEELSACAYAGLKLSEELARRAELARYTSPLPGTGQVHVPPSQQFAFLKRATRFTKNEIDELIMPLPMTTLSPIMGFPGWSPALPSEDFYTSGALYSRPLLRIGNEVVVLTPSAFATSIIFLVFRRAQELELEVELITAYREHVDREVARGLKRLGWEPVVVPGTGDLDWAVESIWAFDHDAACHVLSITDTLEGWSLDRAFGSSPYRPGDLISERITLTRTLLAELPHVPKTILHLVAMQNVGRHFGFGVSNDLKAEVLLVDAAGLSTICQLERGDPLSLLKFLRSRDRAGSRFMPLSSTLDVFTLYEKHRYSFYMHDEQAPNLISIVPGLGLELQMEDLRARDPHAVLSPDGTHVLEVERLYKGSSAPLYVPDPVSSPMRGILVEGPIHIWVVPMRSEDVSEVWEMCETAAYWVWQLAPELSALRAEREGQPQRLVLRVARALSGGEEHADSSSLTIINLDADSLALKYDLGPLWLGPENHGDRLLVKLLISRLTEVLTGPNVSFLGIHFERVVETYAPLGRKKKLLLVDSRNSELAPGDLPPARVIHAADEALVLDGRGKSVSTALELPVGNVRRSRRTDVLNWLVSSLFGELSELIATLSSQGLLEELVARNEAYVREIATLRLTLPTRVACFGNEGEFNQRLEDLRTADIANRFLVEYVVSQRPPGDQPLTLQAWDRLLALSWQVISWGQLSDALHHGLADTELTILSSGRLGIARDGKYWTGMDAFHRTISRIDQSEPHESYSSYWRGDENPATPADGFSEAFEAEFGLTVEQFAQANRILLEESRRSAREPSTMSYATFVRSAEERFGWTPNDADRFVVNFGLSPRLSFIPTDRGHEAYPWRFNRDLSYVRRPVLIRDGAAGRELMWGERHMSRSVRRLFEIIFSGQFRSQSPEMKHFMSMMAHESGESLNDDVAGIFSAQGQSVVRKRVKKVGGVRLARQSGEPIGDVDVLVAYPLQKLVLAVETKDFAAARTPFELASEMEKVLGAVDSAIVHHAERISWLRANLSAVLEELNLALESKWTVAGLIVVSETLMSPYVRSATIPVVSLRQLREEGEAAILGDVRRRSRP